MGHLSVAACKRLKTSAGRRREVPDGGGLYLIVQPSGHKSWALRYRVPSGKVMKLTLGSFTDQQDGDPVVGQPLSPAAARILAARIQIEREKGIDPIAERKAARRRIAIDDAKKRSLTFVALAQQFFEQEQRDEKGLRTWRKQARVLGLLYPDDGEPQMIRGSLAERWGDRPVSEITADDLFEAIDEAHTTGLPGRRPAKAGASASRRIELAKVLSTFIKYLRRRRLITGEALAGIDVPRKTRSGKRVLSNDELKKVWVESEKLDRRHRDIVRLLILTGQRIGEVSGMRWSEISGETWALPAQRSKNKREHAVHLVEAAREIVSIHKNECEHVFAGREKFTAISGFGKAKAKLDELSSFAEPWKFHDIRRTVYTRMIEMGFAPNVVAAVVNHTSEQRSGIAAVYDQAELAEPKRRALEAWAARVAEIIEGNGAYNVVPLRA